MPYCSVCGSKLDGSEGFCTNCGEQQVDVTSTQGQSPVASGAKGIGAKWIFGVVGVVIALIIGVVLLATRDRVIYGRYICGLGTGMSLVIGQDGAARWYMFGHHAVSGRSTLTDIKHSGEVASPWSEKKEIIKKPEFVVQGNLFFDNERPKIIPYVIYKNGKFFSCRPDTEIERKKLETREIKDSFRDAKTYWLYNKRGVLVGRFDVTNIEPDYYEYAFVWGEISWEKGYTHQFGYRLFALSQPINQQKFFLEKKFLSKEQISKLNDLPNTVIRNASEFLVKKGLPKVCRGIHKSIGKKSNMDYEVFDIDSDGRPEVYVSVLWLKEGKGYAQAIADIFATWKDSNWKIIRYSAYCPEEEKAVKSATFRPLKIIDINGDGVAELILEEERLSQTGVVLYTGYVLYQMQNHQLKKALFIHSREYGDANVKEVIF